jgi:hypothetical protein
MNNHQKNISIESACQYLEVDRRGFFEKRVGVANINKNSKKSRNWTRSWLVGNTAKFPQVT